MNSKPGNKNLEDLEDQKKRFEIEKLQVEISNLKRAGLEDQKKRFEIEKLEVEIDKLRKEKNWARLTLQNIMQLLPGIALVIITLIIAFKNNLLESKKVQYTQNQFLQDSTNLLQRLKNERELQEAIVLKEDAKKGAQLYGEKTDSLNQLQSRLRDSSNSLHATIKELNNNYFIAKKHNLDLENKRLEQEQSIKYLTKQQIQLENKNKFAVWEYNLSMLKIYKSGNNLFFSNLIQHINNNGEYKERILDSIQTYKNNTTDSYYDFVLYIMTGNIESKNAYITELKRAIDSCTDGRILVTNYRSLIYSPYLKLNDEYDIAEVVINKLWGADTNITKRAKIDLLSALANYSYDTLYNLAETNYGLFYKYLKMNYDILIKYRQQDDDPLFNCIINIAEYCPQLLVSLWVASAHTVLNNYRLNKITSREQQKIFSLFSQFINDELYRIPIHIHSKISEMLDFREYGDKMANWNLDAKTDKKLAEKGIKYMYDKTKKWHENELQYIKNNKEDILKKLKSLEF